MFLALFSTGLSIGVRLAVPQIRTLPQSARIPSAILCVEPRSDQLAKRVAANKIASVDDNLEEETLVLDTKMMQKVQTLNRLLGKLALSRDPEERQIAKDLAFIRDAEVRADVFESAIGRAERYLEQEQRAKVEAAKRKAQEEAAMRASVEAKAAEAKAKAAAEAKAVAESQAAAKKVVEEEAKAKAAAKAAAEAVAAAAAAAAAGQASESAAKAAEAESKSAGMAAGTAYISIKEPDTAGAPPPPPPPPPPPSRIAPRPPPPPPPPPPPSESILRPPSTSVDEVDRDLARVLVTCVRTPTPAVLLLGAAAVLAFVQRLALVNALKNAWCAMPNSKAGVKAGIRVVET